MSSGPKQPPFDAVYFDTNVLLEHHWPAPLPALGNFLRLAGWGKIARYFPEPVIDELRAHWSRKLREATERLMSARESVSKAASPISCDVRVEHPTVSILKDQFRDATRNAMRQFGVTSIEYTKRSSQEIFAYAVEYKRPFAVDAESKGFQDAIIVLSILDHLREQSEIAGVLITNDKALRNLDYRPFLADFKPDRLRVADLDSVFSELYEPYFDKTRVQPYRRLLEEAARLSRAELRALKEFVASRLTTEMLRPGVAEQTREIVGIEKVEIRRVDLPFPETEPTNTSVDITIKVMVTLKAIVAVDYGALRGLFGDIESPSEPARDKEKRITWFGVIQASGSVVSGELREMKFQNLTADEF